MKFESTDIAWEEAVEELKSNLKTEDKQTIKTLFLILAVIYFFAVKTGLVLLHERQKK